jgi:hypothetical protein
MANEDFKCANCQYFADRQIMGICRIYPEQQNKHESDWCGQHKPVQVKTVYSIMTDETVLIPRLKRKYTKKFNV